MIGEKIKTRIIELDREKNRIILSEDEANSGKRYREENGDIEEGKRGDVLEGTIELELLLSVYLLCSRIRGVSSSF